MFGQLGGDEGFADAGGTKEDRLPLALDGGDPGSEGGFVEEGEFGGFGKRLGDWEIERLRDWRLEIGDY